MSRGRGYAIAGGRLADRRRSERCAVQLREGVARPNQTRVVATLGPASWSSESIRGLIEAGVDCFRINFSHMDGPDALPLIERVRETGRQMEVHIPILADIQGPKLRIGEMPDGGVLLEEGQPFTLTGRDIGVGSERMAHCDYEDLADDVTAGTHILLADGAMELEVERVEGRDVHTRVCTGGRLFSNKGINVPHTRLSVRTLTAKDREDLRFIGAETDVDIVAISFVRGGFDLEQARELLGEGRDIPVLAKLETPEVLDRLDEVLHASDGVMVARGDLGVEVPFEQVPCLQKGILGRAAQRGKWVCVATQMLGSMTRHRRPTRAEVSDVANAVLDGTDALMLSEETATGEHPALAVRAMCRIAAEAEAMDGGAEEAFEADITSFAAGAAYGAVGAAERLEAKAIVALAGSGETALAVSKCRPRIPVLALSVKPATLRRLNLLRGVSPVPLAEKMDMEDQILAADRYLKREQWASPGDVVVIVAAVPLGEGRQTNTIRLHHVRDEDDAADTT